MRLPIAGAFACLLVPVLAEAKPARDLSGEFRGDRWTLAQAGTTAADVARTMRCPPPHCQRNGKARHHYRKKRRPQPGYVQPLAMRNILRGLAEEIRNAGPSKSLAGVVAPLAAKAREIQSICGSRIISAVRHTYIAGTGGRLSLHASGRAIDIVGNPSCIYAQLRGWPGGVSVDYARVRHVHFSYNPRGAEWGTRFNHYRGGRRHRHARRRA